MNESNFLEASECCVDLKGQIYRDGDIDIDKLKGVPIAQQLCPLQVLLHTSTTGGLKRFGEFRYVKYELVNRCCGIFTNLKRIVIRAIPRRDRETGSTGKIRLRDRVRIEENIYGWTRSMEQ